MVGVVLMLSGNYLTTIMIDGYTNATQNRTIFPISDGIINLKSGHPSWTGKNFTIILKLVRQANTAFCTAQLELLSPPSKTRPHSLISTLLRGISWPFHFSSQTAHRGTASRSTSQRLVSLASGMERM